MPNEESNDTTPPETKERHPEEISLDQCRTTNEIEDYRVDKLKKLQQERMRRNIIKQEKLIAQKEKIRLQEKIKDFEIAEDKANNNISHLTTEIELAKTKYWRVKE